VVFENGGNPAVGNRRGVAGNVLIYGKTISVVLVEPVLRTEPHETIAVLLNGINDVVREPLIDGNVVESIPGIVVIVVGGRSPEGTECEHQREQAREKTLCF
jgi:hypothetical protein